MNSGCVACGCQLIPLSGSAQRETIGLVNVLIFALFSVKRGSVGNTRLLSHAKMLLVPMNCSLRASSPIWASEASLARTREQVAKPRGAGERRACNDLS